MKTLLILALVILLSAVFVTWSTKRFFQRYTQDVKHQLDLCDYSDSTLLTEEDIKDLPVLVQKYIRYAGAIGKPKVNNFRVEFSGGIRKNSQTEWMSFVSEQYNFMHSTTRHFFMKAIMKHLPVSGYHFYNDGSAFMDIRLLSCIKVQYQDGAKMNISETVTFFNDMCCMAPATLIDKRIKWLETNHNRARAQFTHKGISISAWLFFNSKGELTNFVSNDRYALGDKGDMLQYQWSTPLKDYRVINGHKIATYAEVIYNYPEGDFCYGTFQLKNLKYNCN